MFGDEQDGNQDRSFRDAQLPSLHRSPVRLEPDSYRIEFWHITTGCGLGTRLVTLQPHTYSDDTQGTVTGIAVHGASAAAFMQVAEPEAH
ncbi:MULTISPECIES: hypothetical protein [Streptomyces]|uniref:hypothetical protein n=1 Tax=Streptomyces TaxID=1883 RepID=UPI001E58AB08|nr:hypothetical protein [Streptomyces sp. MC1]